MKIPLTKGKFALIDDEDFSKVEPYKWQLSSGYAVHRYDVLIDGKRLAKTLYMHRLINATPVGWITDHVNLDRLDNRKQNLRTCSYSENRVNRRTATNNTSGHKGIHWHNTSGKWGAKIKIDGHVLYLGRYKRLIDAINTYTVVSMVFFGSYTRVN